MKLIRTSISLPADVHARMSKLARANRRSMSAEIVFQLEKPNQPKTAKTP